MEAGTIPAATDDEAKAEAARLLQERITAADPGAEQQATEQTMPSETPPPLDDVEQDVPHREWHFEGEYKVLIRGEEVQQNFERTYVQKPLAYSAMMEFTGLLGRKIDELMAGPTGLSIDAMGGGGALGIPLGFQDGTLVFQSTDGGGADAVVQALAKLIGIMPDIILEAQCIWLRVPRQERPILMDIWARPIDEGGMSHDDGEELMGLFIEQNYEELENFFVRRLANHRDRVQRARKKMLARRAA